MKQPNGSEAVPGAIKACPCEDGKARRVTLAGPPGRGYVQVCVSGRPVTIMGEVVYGVAGYVFRRKSGSKNAGAMVALAGFKCPTGVESRVGT